MVKRTHGFRERACSIVTPLEDTHLLVFTPRHASPLTDDLVEDQASARSFVVSRRRSSRRRLHSLLRSDSIRYCAGASAHLASCCSGNSPGEMMSVV